MGLLGLGLRIPLWTLPFLFQDLFVTTFLRRRRPMEPSARENSDLADQEVMSAQSTRAIPQPAERMEGESSGPNYAAPPLGGDRAGTSHLPNGVPRPASGSPPGVEIESLQTSPVTAAAHDRVGGVPSAPGGTTAPHPTGFFPEVWPTQPESMGVARGNPMAWMTRLGKVQWRHGRQ